MQEGVQGMSLEMIQGPAPQLGLVCITHSEAVRYRALTRKRLLQFPPEDQHRMLRELYAANLGRLNLALDFCEQHQLKLYCMTSGLFPFADDDIGEALLEEFSDSIRQTG